jgi:hypothetical protein
MARPKWARAKAGSQASAPGLRKEHAGRVTNWGRVRARRAQGVHRLQRLARAAERPQRARPGGQTFGEARREAQSHIGKVQGLRGCGGVDQRLGVTGVDLRSHGVVI